ncbi:hypothetical protein SLNSH_02795 [Alsobacter soli]|uniref:Uncharacterized protein n=1 Tax=Alsobacter soli TaxID=2109933 RepID=A0A2T1HYJ8_9HYPH|nr:hypothetical protein [Alsobacter soli]PSC06741.1 hypothetical protein SLNSH_02795 [Alsobacter soli]
MERILAPSLDVFEAVLDLDEPSDDALAILYTNLLDLRAITPIAGWSGLPKTERLEQIHAAVEELRHRRSRLN